MNNNNFIKNSDFLVPDGYFDSLEGNLRNVVLDEKHDSFAVKVLKPAFALAFTFVFIIGIGYGFLRLTSNYEEDESSELLVLLQELDYLNPSYFEFIAEDELDYYNFALDEEELFEYLSNDGFISNELFNSITSIEK